VEPNIFHRALVGTMPYVPQPVVWRFSRRYIAGTELEDALATVQSLNAAGCTATVDVLGEDSTDRAQVDDAIALYKKALQGIRDDSLDCNVSVKLSDLGLRFDADYCMDVLRQLLSAAREHDNFVRIDMEDSSVTTKTFEIYKEMRSEFANVGVALQSCLRRSEKDVEELLAGGRAHVRLCKGIYIEPEDIAYRDADEIRESFKGLLEQLFEGGAERVGIATHDPLLVTHAEETIRKMGVTTDRYEFQMLLGVAGRLRKSLVEKGHPLRVYVPFGQLWFDYSLRRLRENPHIAGHIIKNLLKPS
jgi:proline dehydrogenase